MIEFSYLISLIVNKLDQLSFLDYFEILYL